MDRIDSNIDRLDNIHNIDSTDRLDSIDSIAKGINCQHICYGHTSCLIRKPCSHTNELHSSYVKTAT